MPPASVPPASVPSNGSPPTSYRALLTGRGTRTAFAAAVVVRLSYATVSLSLLLLVRAATGSYAAAGTVLGAYALPSLTGPLKARLVDARGRSVLGALGAGYAAALALVGVLGTSGATSAGPYTALAVLAGLLAPPVGPVMRGIWAALTAPGQDRRRAYGLDAVSEEATFALGPLLVAALVGVPSLHGVRGPAVALAVTAALALGGCLLMAAVPVGAPGAARRQALGAGSASPAQAPVPRGVARLLGPLSVAGVRWSVLALFGVGLGAAPLDLSVIARTRAAGHPAAAGYLLAALATASALGALAWGLRSHRRTPTTHVLGLLGALAVTTAACALAPDLALLAVALVATGAVLAPVFVTAYALVDDVAPPAARTEASTWVNTAYNLGIALGAAGAGALVEDRGPRAALLCAALLLAATTAALAPARGSTRTAGG